MGRIRKQAGMKAELDLNELGVAGRVSFAAGVGAAIQTSSVAAANPQLMAAGNKTAQDGVAVAAAQSRVDLAKQDLASAEADLVTVVTTFDNDAAVYRVLGQTASKTPADLQSLHLTPLQPKATPATPSVPQSLSAKPGKKKGQVYYSAKAVRGITTYQVQSSGDPVAPDSFSTTDATKVRDTLSGLPSGKRLWLRIRAARGTLVSDWSEPVAVLVP